MTRCQKVTKPTHTHTKSSTDGPGVTACLRLLPLALSSTLSLCLLPCQALPCLATALFSPVIGPESLGHSPLSHVVTNRRLLLNLTRASTSFLHPYIPQSLFSSSCTPFHLLHLDSPRQPRQSRSPQSPYLSNRLCLSPRVRPLYRRRCRHRHPQPHSNSCSLPSPNKTPTTPYRPTSPRCAASSRTSTPSRSARPRPSASDRSTPIAFLYVVTCWLRSIPSPSHLLLSEPRRSSMHPPALLRLPF